MKTKIGFSNQNDKFSRQALMKYLKLNKLEEKTTLLSFNTREKMLNGLKENRISRAILNMGDTFQGRIEKNYDHLYRENLYINAEVKLALPGKTGHSAVIMNYYIISGNPDVPAEKKGKKYNTLIAITPHIDRPGLLRDISSVISIYNVNMTDIFSRPAVDFSKGEEGSKMFYIIMEGHIMSDTFQTNILEGIRSILQHSEIKKSFRFLGCYAAGE